MTTKRNLLLASALLSLCGAGLLSAAPAVGIGQGGNPPGLSGASPRGLAKQGKCVKAPEIDASAGVQAIALLSGILLLVGERARRRRNSERSAG